MKVIKFLIPIICSLSWAQELKVHNEYIFTSKDSILIDRAYELDFIDTVYYEKVWESVNIDNKLNVTLINNQRKPLLFYLDTENTNAIDDKNFSFKNDLGSMNYIITDENGNPVSFELKYWHIQDVADFYGKPKESYSLEPENWNVFKNTYERLEKNLFILYPNEKLNLYINIRLPVDINQQRTSSYDFSKNNLSGLQIIFTQSAKAVKEKLSKNVILQLQEKGIEIFDGAIISNEINVLELKKSK